MSSPPISAHAPAGDHRRRGLHRRGWGWRVLLCLVCLGGATTRAAEPEVSKEYQIKASFLYNFTKFVEWPPGRFADETSPIVIGVLGRNPFGGELEVIVRGRTVNGRTVLVKPIHSAGELSAVHLLFVPVGEETHLTAAAWREAGIVTVGESAAFTALGGMISFTLEADKVRFEINLRAAEQSRLKLSAQLLKLATLVHREP